MCSSSPNRLAASRRPDDITLNFADGSLTAVIGPNGAGKSTFFNLITGALKPDSGRILLDGIDMAGARRLTSCVTASAGPFQVASIFPSLTVHETMLAAVCADQRRASVLHRRFPLAETPRPRRTGDGSAGSRQQARSDRGNAVACDQKLLDIRARAGARSQGVAA